MRAQGSEAGAGDGCRGCLPSGGQRRVGRSWAVSHTLPHPGSPRTRGAGLRGRVEVGVALEAEGVGSNRQGPAFPRCVLCACAVRWGSGAWPVQLGSTSPASSTRAWPRGLLGLLEPWPCRLRSPQKRMMTLSGSLLMTAGHRGITHTQIPTGQAAPLDSAETQPRFPPTPHPDQCPTVPVVALGTQSSGRTPTGPISASASPKVGSDRARACRQGASP